MNERPNNDQQQDHSKYLERYALLIGKLVVNFQGLELLLRTFLQEQPGTQRPRLPQGETIFSPPLGSIVDLCPLTDWDTLGMLIDKYNAIAEGKGWPKLDSSLVGIRDALAHGRIAAFEFGKPPHLFKYSKPLKGNSAKVKVTFNETLDEAWFSKQVTAVNAAMQAVYGRLSDSIRTVGGTNRPLTVVLTNS
jgi:hypothetical protein